jgi:hypothetical protein
VANLKERFYKEMEILAILHEAGKRGNHIDEQLRQELKLKLEGILYEQIMQAQQLVAPKFVKIKYYQRLPKGVDPTQWATVNKKKTVQQCSSCGKLKVSVKHKCPNGPEWQKQPTVVESPFYYHLSPLAAVDSLPKLQAYLRQAGFNPCSSNQMMLYMKAHHHPVGTNHKTKQDTADVKHLKKLVGKYGKKHPIYAHTLHIRLVQKALSQYVNGLEPDEQGLIHTTYCNATSTWRLAARNINVQNLGKRAGNPYAKDARRVIIPREGFCFVQADSAAIEAVFVGHFMTDQNYIRLARKGVHAYLVGKYMGESFTPLSYTSQDNDRIKAQYKAEYDKFKQVNHGTNFGMGPYLMHMNEPETFPTVQDAERVQEFIFRELPALPEWHHQLRVFAQKNGYLENPWGVRHQFYDVYTYKYDDDRRLILDEHGRPQIKLGKDGKRVIAFKPQSSAGMFMRDNLWLLGRTKLKQYLPAVVSIHDGYTVEVPMEPEWVDYAVETLGNILTRPIIEMGGLRVGAEVELAVRNFLEFKHVTTLEVD